MVTIRTIISLAAYKGWKLWQLDVKIAFLYGELDRDIFMEQPHGFISKEFPNHVCRLKKALYGLKQAPRAWYGKIAQYLIFVVSSLQMQIQVYLLRKRPQYAQCFFSMWMT